MKKLTPRQLEVLKLLALPGNKAVWQPSAGNYIPRASWYIGHSDMGRDCTRQIKILMDRGFVRQSRIREIAIISAEGEKYLEDNLLIKGKGAKL